MSLFGEVVKKFDILLVWLFFALILFFFCIRNRVSVVGWLLFLFSL